MDDIPLFGTVNNLYDGLDDPPDPTKRKAPQEVILDIITRNYWIQLNTYELYNPHLKITESYRREIVEYSWDIKEIQRLKNTHNIFYFAGWHGITFLCTKGETERHEGYNFMVRN